MPFSVFNAAGAALNQSLTDTPVGSIQPFAGASAPSGWLLCDGAAVSRTDYAELFAVLGTTYGTGNGSTTFNVPDLRGRVPAGLDNMGGNAASRLTNTVLSASNTLGATGGAQTHTLATSEMPAHTHDIVQRYRDSSDAHTHGSVNGKMAQAGASSGWTDTTNAPDAAATRGGGNAHTNTQPTLVVNYIILASSLATRLQAAALPQYVTSLPSSPVDGQTVHYQPSALSAANVIYTMRYNSAASKWQFVGGQPQIVSTTKADTFSSSSASFVDVTGLSATITPTFSTSQVLVTGHIYNSNDGANLNRFNLVRGSTTIAQPSTSDSYSQTIGSSISGGSTYDGVASFQYLDSPATTSSTTYKIQVRPSSGTSWVNRRGDLASVKSVSTITVQEIVV